MLEIEKKYVLADQEDLLRRLADAGAVEGKTECHVDTYYRHPCRDFVKTNEALRVRRVDSVASVTYKGPKLDLGDANLKAREEIEWTLAPADADGSQMTRLLLALGFSSVTAVKKERRSFQWPQGNPEFGGFTLTIDRVDQVGLFAEVELLIDDGSSGSVDRAGERINGLANRLGLVDAVRKSYLQMLLDKIGQ